jgi:hypothetical protein
MLGFRFLFLSLLLVCLTHAKPVSASGSISFSRLGQEVDKKRSGNSPYLEGVIGILPAPMQDLRGELTSHGLTVHSTADESEGQGSLSLIPQSLYKGSAMAIPAGTVSLRGEVLQLDRGVVREEFRTSTDGIRQDFIISQRPAGNQALELTLAVQGARVRAAQGGVSLTLESGRKLLYDKLHITDADGVVLQGSLVAIDAERLAIFVQDFGARYPLTIDPTLSDADWASMNGGLTGFDAVYGYLGNVNALVVDASGNLYAGGEFAMSDTVTANVAMWDGSRWKALGRGMRNNSNSTFSGEVHALAVDAVGNLYAGGRFDTAGTVAALNIAKWDGTAWSTLDLGLGGTVSSLIVDASGMLYASVASTVSSGSNTWWVGSVLQWNGTKWTSLGKTKGNSTYDNSEVNALSLDAAGNLYAGGKFSSIGSVSAGNIAKWDGVAWTTPFYVSGTVNAIALDASGNVFVGGGFSSVGVMGAASTKADNVAHWDGSTWRALGVGVAFGVNVLLLDGSGDLYVAGSASAVTKWDGSAWSNLGSGLTFPGSNTYVNALALDASGRLFVGGVFASAGGVAASHIACWSQSQWSSLGAQGFNSTVHAFATDGSNLYVGGRFTTFANGIGRRIAKWDGSSWSTLGTGLTGIDERSVVSTMVLDGSGNLYVGGNFTSAGGVSASNVAKWDGVAWSSVGRLGQSYEYVNALVLDANGVLYAGGSFSGGVQKFDGTTWSKLGAGGGANNSVSALVLDASGNLYAGGWFTTMDGVNMNRVAKWNGTAWSPLGSGFSSSVGALALDASGTLYAGEDQVFKWDGKAWTALSNGFANKTSWVNALTFDATGNLYAGGYFSITGVAAGTNLAMWDGSTWSSLGSGTDGTVYTLAIAPSGGLYVGGYFKTAGNKYSPFLARYNLAPAAPAPPTAQNKSVTILEDSPYAFSASSWGYQDVNGDALTQVRITRLASQGSLKLDGVDVTLNQEIAAADFSKLVYTPVKDAYGTPYDSIGFQVYGGGAYSVSTNTLSIQVTGVPDAPEITTWPTVAGITYGQTLAQASLTGAVHGTAGAFAFSADATKPSVGVTEYEVRFTPEDGVNYTTVTKLLAVSTAPLAITVTADAQSKVLGASDPLLSYTVSPELLEGDKLQGSLSRVEGELAGTYEMSLGSLAHGNYSLSFVPAYLTITEEELSTSFPGLWTLGSPALRQEGDGLFLYTAGAAMVRLSIHNAQGKLVYEQSAESNDSFQNLRWEFTLSSGRYQAIASLHRPSGATEQYSTMLVVK